MEKAMEQQNSETSKLPEQVKILEGIGETEALEEQYLQRARWHFRSRGSLPEDHTRKKSRTRHPMPHGWWTLIDRP
ncbi:hypothetical protein P3L10_030072 [Capsicum annuum]